MVISASLCRSVVKELASIDKRAVEGENQIGQNDTEKCSRRCARAISRWRVPLWDGLRGLCSSRHAPQLRIKGGRYASCPTRSSLSGLQDIGLPVRKKPK